MGKPVISVEHLSKSYRLGQIGTGTFAHDLNVWWAKVRGKPNPLSRIGEADHGNRDGESIWALKDVSFTVEQGEVLGIIGRNGAGKSTLLKILSRVTAPTSGRIRVKGRVASLLEVGTGFHPELTGRENIYLNGAILGMSRREINRKLDEIVDFAEIEKFIDTPVKRYSSGMYVRLAFAVAAHLEPEILVVDEVLAVGDAEFQKKCLGKMGDVASQGKTVLFVSHNMAAIRMLCSKSILLEGGEVKTIGNTQDIIATYLESTTRLLKNEYSLYELSRNGDLGKSFRLTHIKFNGGQPVLHGEPLSIELEYETDKDWNAIAIGIGFNSMEGIRILSFDSDLIEIPFSIVAGAGQVSMNIDELCLQPGIYFLDIAARYGKTSLDYLPACFQVEVLPGPNTPPIIIHPDGGVRFPANWSLLKKE